MAWAIFDEMKGLSGFHCCLMVFSNVPSAEQGGESIGNTSRNLRFVSLSQFVMFFSELRNGMLLQEREKVNISRDVEQQLWF